MLFYSEFTKMKTGSVFSCLLSYKLKPPCPEVFASSLFIDLLCRQIVVAPPIMLWLNSSHRPRPPLSSVDICNETVSCSHSARNIGVIFDQSLCLVPHVNAVCQSSFFHLRNIGFIRKYLTYDAAKIIIHAFVVSKLDYCNSLLYGLPSYLIRKLQHVQNSAARLVNQCPRFWHIAPVLRDLH